MLVSRNPTRAESLPIMDADNEPTVNRDTLALDRTRLANERTLLAYFRTAIMLVITGASIIKLYGDSPFLNASGWFFIGLGVTVTLIGVTRYRRLNRVLNAQ